MSIHSLAKELGVSEYALRQYAEKHNLQNTRTKNNRRCGYKFTEQDLKNIKEEYSLKSNPEILFLMYRLYDKNFRNHLYLPAGFFPKKDEALLKEFVSMQYSITNSFGEKCYNFFICTRRQYDTRLKKLKSVLGNSLCNILEKELISKLITSENLPSYVKNKVIITYKNFVPKIIRDFLANNQPQFISLDEQIERGFDLSYDDNNDLNY